MGLGVIGAGKFARLMLLPNLQRDRRARLVGVATSSGASAQVTGRQFGFQFGTTSHEELLAHADIGAVVIATPPGSHARLVCAALAAGKDVFVEKPLARSREELAEVLRAQKAAGRSVLVGFNRRYAPATTALLEWRRQVRGPLQMLYRVNAGPPGEEAAEAGASRIIDEVCHFVDLLQAVAGAEPVVADAARGAGGEADDSLAATIRFADGSLGTILYCATGDRSLAKEYVEVYGGGSTFVIEDFRTWRLHRKERSRRTKRLEQDKGHRAEMEHLVSVLTEGLAPRLSCEEAARSTLVTLALEDCLRTGARADLRAQWEALLSCSEEEASAGGAPE